jgi:magnesium transporter
VTATDRPVTSATDVDTPENHVVTDVVEELLEDDPERIHVVTGSTRDVPGPAQDVVEVEGGSAGRSHRPGKDAHVRVLSFKPDGSTDEVAIDAIAEIVASDTNFVWIDLIDSPDALRRIAPILSFTPHEVHAALSPWQRPALDVSGDHFFASVTLPRANPEDRQVMAGRISLFVGKNYLVSVHRQPLPFDDSVLARCRLNPELPRLDSAYMLYILLDGLIEYFEDQADDTDEEIERMELKALVEADDAFLGELLRLKRYVYALNRLVEQHRQVFEAFLRPDFPFVSGEDISGYFRDLDGRLDRVLVSLGGVKESVTGAFDIYVSRVSHQTNQVIKLLTIVSTLLLPMTVVIAFFETSFHGISGLYSIPAFVVMLGIIASTTTVFLVVFRRLGWLG